MTESASDAGRRGIALAQAGRHELAIPLLRAGLAGSPADSDLLNNLSMSLLHTGELHEALDVANFAIASRPESDWSHRLRSIALGQLGDNKGALASAIESQRLGPNDSRAHLSVSDCYFRMQKWREAESAAREALRVAPNTAAPLTRLGAIALEQRQLDRAKDLALKALKVEPDSSAARNLLGVVERMTNSEGSARRHFSAAAGANVQDDNPRANFADSMIHGSMRTVALWRMVIVPATFGLCLGLFGLLGAAIALAGLALIRLVVTEVRMRSLDPSTRSYVRGQRAARWRPRSFVAGLDPRRLARHLRGLARRGESNFLVGFAINVTVVFVVSFFIGRAFR